MPATTTRPPIAHRSDTRWHLPASRKPLAVPSKNHSSSIPPTFSTASATELIASPSTVAVNVAIAALPSSGLGERRARSIHDRDRHQVGTPVTIRWYTCYQHRPSGRSAGEQRGNMTRTWWVKSRFVAFVTAFSLVCRVGFGCVGRGFAEGDGPRHRTPTEGARLWVGRGVGQGTCTPNGHTSFNIVGGGPFCVSPWAKGNDNGGATAPGVTATEVKIVAYIPNDQMLAGGTGAAGPKNQATGADAKIPDTIADYVKLYDFAQAQLGTYQFGGVSRTSRSSPRVVPMRPRSAPTRSR